MIGVELLWRRTLIELYYDALRGDERFFEENRGDVLRALRALCEASFTCDTLTDRYRKKRAGAVCIRQAVANTMLALPELGAATKVPAAHLAWKRIGELLSDDASDLTSDEVVSAALDGLGVR